jgi:CDP-diacylglycerol---serine O-phosphatidyltransferase
MTGEVRRRLRRGAYLLPSAFTIGNILLGFYAVVRGYHGDFQKAALLVLAAGVLDSIDGKVARMTGTESDFGREYDSLADVFTFGAVPALLAFLWGLKDLGDAGWLVALFFLVCTATRLARFNVQTRIVDSRFFVGLPSPAAAGGVISILYFAPDPDWRPWVVAFLMGALLILGSLMVSTFRYRSIKKLDLRQRRSYRALLMIAAVLIVVAYHPPAFFLAASSAYALSGPLGWLLSRISRRSEPPTPAEKPA